MNSPPLNEPFLLWNFMYRIVLTKYVSAYPLTSFECRAGHDCLRVVVFCLSGGASNANCRDVICEESEFKHTRTRLLNVCDQKRRYKMRKRSTLSIREVSMWLKNDTANPAIRRSFEHRHSGVNFTLICSTINKQIRNIQWSSVICSIDRKMMRNYILLGYFHVVITFYTHSDAACSFAYKLWYAWNVELISFVWTWLLCVSLNSRPKHIASLRPSVERATKKYEKNP